MLITIYLVLIFYIKIFVSAYLRFAIHPRILTARDLKLQSGKILYIYSLRYLLVFAALFFTL